MAITLQNNGHLYLYVSSTRSYQQGRTVRKKATWHFRIGHWSIKCVVKVMAFSDKKITLRSVRTIKMVVKLGFTVRAVV